jgi:hypothetical protein
MSRLSSTLFLTALCACLVSCNTTTPTSPLLTAALEQPQTVYSGSIIDSVKGSGTIVISLSNGGGFTGGTWLATFNGKGDGETLVSGTVSGNAYVATVTQCAETDISGCSPNCALSFKGSLTSTAIAGTYGSIPRGSCSTRAGTVDARR